MKILLIDSQRKYIHPKELRKIRFEIIAGAFFFYKVKSWHLQGKLSRGVIN